MRHPFFNKNFFSNFPLIASLGTIFLLASCNGPGLQGNNTPRTPDVSVISSFRLDNPISVSNWVDQLDDYGDFSDWEASRGSDRIEFFKLVSPITDCSKPSQEVRLYSFTQEQDLHLVVRMEDSTTVKVQMIDLASSDKVKDVVTAVNTSDTSATSGAITVTARDERNIVISKAGPKQLHFVYNPLLAADQIANICRYMRSNP
jgi:hypothetical protein